MSAIQGERARLVNGPPRHRQRLSSAARLKESMRLLKSLVVLQSAEGAIAEQVVSNLSRGGGFSPRTAAEEPFAVRCTETGCFSCKEERKNKILGFRPVCTGSKSDASHTLRTLGRKTKVVAGSGRNTWLGGIGTKSVFHCEGKQSFPPCVRLKEEKAALQIAD